MTSALTNIRSTGQTVQQQIYNTNDTPDLFAGDVQKIDYPFTGSISEVSSVVLTETEEKIKELKALYANKNGLEVTIISMNQALQSTSTSGTEGKIIKK